jgi:hypothetical protein
MLNGVVAGVRRPSQRARASVANDPRRLSAAMDLRTHGGRRFSDLFDALAQEFGPGADPERIREITVLKFELEKAQAAGTATLEDTVRVFNLVARKEKELRFAKARKRQIEQTEGLRSKLSSRYAGKGGAP